MKKAFTLLELLVVMAVICALAALLLPVLHRATQAAKQTVCVGNLRQLQQAWWMLTDDQAGELPRNREDYFFARWQGVPVSWVLGDARIDGLDSIHKGTLFPYLKNEHVYRCPGDHAVRECPPLHNPPRTRSYALNWRLASEIGGYLEEGLFTPVGSFTIRQPDERPRHWNLAAVLKPAGVWTFVDTSTGTIDSGVFAVVRNGHETANRHPREPLAWVDGHVLAQKVDQVFLRQNSF